MVNGRPGPAPRLLPAGVTEEQLRAVVAANRSWRAVMRALGLKSASFGPKLRNACNELDIDYGHFRSILATDARLREVVTTSTDWPTALSLLGYATGSGTARATLRKHCKRLGVDTSHLAVASPSTALPAAIEQLVPKRKNLRDAGPISCCSLSTPRAFPQRLAPKEPATTSWPTCSLMASSGSR